jgi:ABC-type uncharacterized transport system substrate-binding protein
LKDLDLKNVKIIEKNPEQRAAKCQKLQQNLKKSMLPRDIS